MMRKSWVVGLIAAMWLTGGRVMGEGYAEREGKRQVERVLDVWKDGKREREVPVLICYPRDLGKGSPAQVPVIVFSHGLGASRSTYEEYGRHWSSYGYVVVFPQHHGTDTAALGTKVMAPAEEMKNFLDRAEDVHFVLDQVELMNAGKMEGTQYGVFKGNLDLKKIGLGGHSFGAITTAAIAGQIYDVPVKGTTYTDSRVVAGLAMSPFPPPLSPMKRGADYDAIYAGIKIPIFYMTGTEDVLAANPEDRKIPYAHSKAAGTAFLMLKGGNHLTFSPFVVPQWPAEKVGFQRMIRESTTAYWDAYLKGDEKAKVWLEKEFPKELGKMGTFEEK